MSGIAALFNFDGEPVARDAIAGMADGIAHRGPDGTGLWVDGPVGLAHQLLASTEEARPHRQPYTTRHLTITADARLDNRHELIAELGLPRNLSLQCDAAIIAAAYERWEESCQERLLGDFAFCIWDARRQTLFGARDHMGIKPFYYHHSERRLVIASEIAAILRVEAVARRLNVDRIGDYLLPCLEDRVSTFFRGIERLPPGWCVSASPRGVRRRRYWSLDASREIRYRTDDDYAAALKDIFLTAVECRLRSRQPVGALLSGGLDSSSIVCAAQPLLAHCGKPPLSTFSAVFERTPQCDERAFIAPVVESTSVNAHYVAGDVAGPFADFLESLPHESEPHSAPNLFVHRALYRTARANGVGVLLDGIDGDHAISHGLSRITELTHQLRLIAASAEIAAVAKRLCRSRWRVARKLAIGPVTPTAVKWLWRSIASQRSDAAGGLLSHSLARQATARANAFASPPSMTARAEHIRGLQSGVMPLALEVADRAAARLQIEVRYPFFDRRLLEFCVALPADQKLRAGWTRWVMRRAMHGVLPAAVQWRPSKADLSPNFTATFLREDQLVSRNFSAVAPHVDMRAVRRLQNRARQFGQSHDAVALWRLATLDAWLQHANL